MSEPETKLRNLLADTLCLPAESLSNTTRLNGLLVDSLVHFGILAYQLDRAELVAALRQALASLRSAYYMSISEREGIRDHDEAVNRVEREPDIVMLCVTLKRTANEAS